MPQLMYRPLLFLLILLTATACSTSGGDAETIPSSASDLDSVGLSESHLLVWYAPGIQPGTHSAPGQIAMMDASGEMTVLFDLPDSTALVQPCGERATSPNGDYFAFYAGGSTEGTLYQIANTGTPEAIEQVHPMSCLGMGTFAYAPDSEQFGYIDFTASALSTDFTRGILRIVESASGDQQLEYDNVAAFDISDTFAAFVSGFANEEGRVQEAGVFRWESGNPVEIGTIFADNNCEFRSGNIHIIDDTSLAVIMGQGCTGAAYHWTVYIVDMTNNSSTELLSGSTGLEGDALYANHVRSSAIFGSPDDSAIFFSYPNGFKNFLVDWQALTLADVDTAATVIEYGVMPRFVTGELYAPAHNAAPVVSPDGRWVAIASNDPDDNAQVSVIDLNTPNLPPIIIDAGPRLSTVSAMGFTRDSRHLLMVTGGSDGDDNSLIRLNLQTATDQRIIRGKFTGQMIISPAGDYVILPEWQNADYTNLAVINLTNNESATLFTGATVENGRATERHFAYPLSWRR